MSGELIVKTGSRLHFGMLAYGHPERRQFGGMGVMIDEPGFEIRARRAKSEKLNCQSWKPRVQKLLERLRSGDFGPIPGPLQLEIAKAPPAHAGFGSGTQLALAVARIVSVLGDEGGELKVSELARRACRGLRSAVGVHGFIHGGLVLESGHREGGPISPLASRTEFPKDWRFVLVRPKRGAGISGTEEAAGFAKLEPMSEQLSNRLCRIALMEILPAVSEQDFNDASQSIGRFGRLVGEYFAPVQGGVFADNKMEPLAAKLAKRGIHGVGQTSWGPTVFILCPDILAAFTLVEELRRGRELTGYEFEIASPLNRGVSVESDVTYEDCAAEPTSGPSSL